MQTTMARPKDARDKPYNVEFGRRFSDALEDQGLTKSEAARIVGMNPSRISEYAIGLRLVPLDTLDMLIRKLNLDPRILFPEWHERATLAAEYD